MGNRFKYIENWKLAILLSAILSLLSVITYSTPQSDLNLASMLPTFFMTFSFLLVAWYLNSGITNLFFSNDAKWHLASKILIVVLANGFLLILFILLSVLISKALSVEREYNYAYSMVRGTVSIVIIYLVQYTLNLNAKNQSVLLQNQMLKTENIATQFEILKQQISPHFLFNSLSSLRSMIRTSNKNAESYVIELSDVYRLLLENKENDTVTLKDELEFIDKYSFLLLARYENMLNIEIDLPHNLLNLRIPTFSLQLLLENCVKHNIISKEMPLHIRIYDSGANSISVENNLQRMMQAVEKSGIGLQNLVKRYELLGVDDGVHVFSDGSVYRIKIKLLDS